MSYEFYVDKAEKVDLVRICRECVEDHPDASAILVVGENALLLLSDGFLAQFNRQDDVVVAYECLDSFWGYRKWQVDQFGPSTISFHRGNIELAGYRGKTVPKDQIEATIKQLHAARAFSRRIKVRVSII